MLLSQSNVTKHLRVILIRIPCTAQLDTYPNKFRIPNVSLKFRIFIKHSKLEKKNKYKGKVNHE